MQKRIKERSHRVCIGVTTGDLLCTCVGARKIRSEYTVFGDAINLSARLMVKCKSGECSCLTRHCLSSFQISHPHIFVAPICDKGYWSS